MSFWRNYYHLTWSTKNRLPLIKPSFEAALFGYILRKAAQLEVYVYAINGTENHIHAIVSIPPKYCVSEVVKLIKGASSHYVNHSIHPTDQFAWQQGYGCLTVSEKQRSVAEEYVNNQKTHHRENKTVPWLEKQSELEEGPERPGESANVRQKVSELKASYDISGDSPF